jgi:cbb3-type cytochrome oxidase subunit 1
MDWFTKAFLKSSLAWLTLGASLGLAMASHAPWTIYRAAHMHMMLLGFVTMMIFGVAYHVVPRFVGHPLYRRTLAGWHWWISNAGLALMVTGFVLRAARPSAGTIVLAAGGSLSTLGAYLFAFLVWRTLDGAETRRTPAPAVAAVSLQTRRAPLTTVPLAPA